MAFVGPLPLCMLKSPPPISEYPNSGECNTARGSLVATILLGDPDSGGTGCTDLKR